MKHLTWMLLCGMSVQLGIHLCQAAPSSAENQIQREDETFVEALARRMKSFMNESVDPCDNFYEYACGNYKNVIEDLESPIKRSSLFDVWLDIIDIADSVLLKTHNPNEEYYEELQIAKNFVNTCSRAQLFPPQQSEDYLKVIRAIGGFPAIDPSWNASAFDWFNMTAHLSRYSVVGFVEETILPVYPFPPLYKLPKLGFGFYMYKENIATKQSDGYIYNEQVMRNLLQLYGVTGTNADFVIEEVFELLREVVDVLSPLLDKELFRNQCRHLAIINGLDPDFDKWKNIFTIAWGEPHLKIPYISTCPCTYFYSKLDQLAKQKPKAFANYMALKFLHKMHLQLKSKKFQRRQCVAYVKSAMPLVFSHFYMKDHRNKEEDDDISEILFELRASWKDLINTADWLDENAQLEALQKLKNLHSHIGQVVDPVSDIYIKQIRKLNVFDNNALNTLQMAKFKVDMDHYGYLHQNTVNKTTAYDLLDALRVRASYFLLENNLSLMSGILRPPVYHKDFPNSVKYATLGYIVGHEIGHGFVDTGFSVTSNLTRRSWLSTKSAVIAKQRSSCFAEDYSRHEEPGLNHKLNGNISLSEIQADSLGLRQALTAYRRLLKYGVKHEGEEFLRKEYLPGLNMSLNQTFFLSFAQLYCAKYEPRNLWGEVYAKHPVDRYRVLGTLKNFDEFSNVYNCPENSLMNPPAKCRLW